MKIIFRNDFGTIWSWMKLCSFESLSQMYSKPSFVKIADFLIGSRYKNDSLSRLSFIINDGFANMLNMREHSWSFLYSSIHVW